MAESHLVSTVALQLDQAYTAGTSPWAVRAWRYHVLADGERAGTISLRDGHTRVFTHLLGHIGFAIDAGHRGHGHAGQAVLALLPEARALGMDTVWITTTPDNAACRATLERIGCTFVEAVEIPPYYDTYARGERDQAALPAVDRPGAGDLAFRDTDVKKPAEAGPDEADSRPLI